MPKSVVVDEAFTWGDDRHPQVPWEDTIIYEAHVKGLTQLREDVPPELRGTYRGLAAPGDDRASAASSASPRSSCCRSMPSSTTGIWSSTACSNYWGYNTLGFFAPEPRYAADNVLERVPLDGRAAARAPASR